MQIGLISHPLLVTALMLAVSNLFMTFAWYGHLKNLGGVAVVYRGAGELGHRVVRVSAAGAGEPHRLHRN